MSKHVSKEAFKQALDAELRRRLEELGEGGDEVAGRFDVRDWAVIGILFLALPLLATWWFS